MRIIALLSVLFGLMLAGEAAVETPEAYTLRPEWSGPCKRAAVIDVNLGNSPLQFVRAANCQITGRELYPESEAHWAKQLTEDPNMRRIDVVRALCKQFGRTCQLSYSDPWLYGETEAPKNCEKRYTRDIGAVVMFFSHCPDGVNCGQGWANNHVRGMTQPDDELGGYYNPSNPGFWRAQLRDAKRAGLQFILPNFYGPDLAGADTLVQILAAESEPVKVGLFDDSWAWGVKKFGTAWAAPNLAQTEAAAQKLYTAKWKPWFSKIPEANWYRINGRPVIYFYNAGTLKPANRAAAVIKRMKALFAADFGVEPFVVVDDAFFADPEMGQVADSPFRWDTLAGNYAHADSTMVDDRLGLSMLNGRKFANAFVRWDSAGRDGADARFKNRRIKGDGLLQAVLARTHDADVLLLQTWNDLGEGTGISQAYDYYDKGQWLRPDHFMRLIREDNCLAEGVGAK